MISGSSGSALTSRPQAISGSLQSELHSSFDVPVDEYRLAAREQCFGKIYCIRILQMSSSGSYLARVRSRDAIPNSRLYLSRRSSQGVCSQPEVLRDGEGDRKTSPLSEACQRVCCPQNTARLRSYSTADQDLECSFCAFEFHVGNHKTSRSKLAVLAQFLQSLQDHSRYRIPSVCPFFLSLV